MQRDHLTGPPQATQQVPKDSWNAKQESCTDVGHLLFFNRTRSLEVFSERIFFLREAQSVPPSPHPYKLIFSANGLYSWFSLHLINMNVFSCCKDISALLTYWLPGSLLYSWSLVRALVCSSSFSVSDIYPSTLGFGAEPVYIAKWETWSSNLGDSTTGCWFVYYYCVSVHLCMHVCVMCVGTCVMECM